jgi:lipid II:glycine glycyltransferase (peptidoglycan interpeptide bridge formation enzyme)
MEFKLARDLDPDLMDKWDFFVKGQKTGSLFQLPLWKDLYLSNKKQCWLFFWGQKEDQFTLAALIRGRRIWGLGVDYTIDRGPVCDDADLLLQGIENLLPFLAKEKAIGLRLDPYWEFPKGERIEKRLKDLGFEPFQRKDDRHFETLTIDLAQSPEEIFSHFRKTTRNEINKAKKMGLKVKIAEDEQELKGFCDLLDQLGRKKAIRTPPYSFFQRLWNSILKQKDLGILLLGYSDDRLVSGVVILNHGERGVYSWGASSVETQEKFSKAHWLIWEGILWAKEMGCRLFDLGGYSGGAESDSSPEQVDLFKKGFRGEFCRLVKIHRYIFQKGKEKWIRPFLS